MHFRAKPVCPGTKWCNFKENRKIPIILQQKFLGIKISQCAHNQYVTSITRVLVPILCNDCVKFRHSQPFWPLEVVDSAGFEFGAIGWNK
jgi:hypothetical protein